MTTTPDRRRQPAGAAASAGGQFATEARQEPSISLSALSPHVRELVEADLADRRFQRLLEADLADRRLRHLDEAGEALRRHEAATAESAAADQALEQAQVRARQAQVALEESEREMDTVRSILHGLGLGEADVAEVSYVNAKVVTDAVRVPNWGTFRRVKPDDAITREFSALRVQVDRELDADEARHVAGLIGYAWAVAGGESLPEPEQDRPNSIVLPADAAQVVSRSRMDAFVHSLPRTILEGSPVRKTDRAGAGTAGTRLVEPLTGVRDVHLFVG